MRGCGHPRQVTPDGGLMPCAYPECVAAHPNPILYTADLPPVDWTKGYVDIPSVALPAVRRWERVDWYDRNSSTHQWFWREVR